MVPFIQFDDLCANIMEYDFRYCVWRFYDSAAMFVCFQLPIISECNEQQPYAV